MQTARRLCCTTIPTPTQKASQGNCIFQLDSSCRNFSITNITFDKIWMHICIYLSLLVGVIKMAVGEFSIQEKKCRERYLCRRLFLDRKLIYFDYSLTRAGATLGSFILKCKLEKFYFYIFAFVWLAGSGGDLCWCCELSEQFGGKMLMHGYLQPPAQP